MTIHFSELKELHQRAMSGGPKSNAFASFAATMYQQFDAIYTAAKALQDDNDALRDAACRPTLKASTRSMDSDQVGALLEAGQDTDPTALARSMQDAFQEANRVFGNVFPGHVFIGMDFQPVTEGLPDDGTLVFMLLSPTEFEPVLLGYHEAGFWYFADSMAVGYPFSVTHWADMPEVEA